MSRSGQPLDNRLADALARLALPGHVPVGGGTDLFAAGGESQPHAPIRVEVGGLPELLGITTLPDGGLRIGAACSLDDIANHALVRDGYPMLAAACAQAAPPSLRATATLGGNVAQRPRCAYFRANVRCHKNGGTTCPAVHGENPHHAILEGGPCWMVHPSDPAVALVALDATMELGSATASRTVPASAFFVLPSARLDRESVLQGDEMLFAATLPAQSRGGMQRFTKRGVDDASYGDGVSLAVAHRTDGEARLVLGGVAPRPYRVYTSVEEEAVSGGLDDETIDGLAERALLDAEPLAGNGYRVDLAAGLLRDAIREIAATRQ
ncbi:MAG: FAD binding domain-containing protein [bacterium]